MPNWLFPWRQSHWQLRHDIIAGLIVAILIIPQAIGYGLLAHLPPSVALASCIFPLLAYAVFGRSHALAVGPVAIISLMVGEALQPLSAEQALPAAQLLALQVALLLGAMRVLNLGNLVHFIGHPVIQGFTASAAILIISKQLPLVLGGNIFQLSSIDPQTTALAMGFIGLLLGFKIIPHDFISKLGPLVVVILGCTWVYFEPNTLTTVNISQSHSIINLSFVLPWPLFEQLLPNAILIALIGLLESTSVAKNLAKQRKENIHANQELLGLSFANLAACVFHAYPVAGGFGRSMVNHQAGASSPLAGVFTAIFVGFLLLFTIDAINYIPLAALGAIVIIAVWPLLEFAPVFKKWQVQPKETAIWLVTFVMVLWQGVEIGILSGVSLSVVFLIRSAAKPHIAIIGQIPDSAHFRNIKRHNVITHPGLLAIRIDEGIHFANQDAINQFIEEALQHNPDTINLLIVCSAVNIIDSDGLDLLQSWNEKLQLQNKQLHLAEVKGPVMDELYKRGFVEGIQPGKIFLSTKQAFDALSQPSEESYII